MKKDFRELKDLDGIGKESLKDFQLLGIKTVYELSRKSPKRLYKQLADLSGPQDICVYDVLCCAVAQAKNSKLPKDQRNWWYWSKKRKEYDSK